MLIKDKNITPFFSSNSNHSSYLENSFKKDYFSAKKSVFYLKPQINIKKALLHTKNNKIVSSSFGDKDPYYTTQNQKLNKTLSDLHNFLQKNFFPVSASLGELSVKKDKNKMIHYSLFPFYKKLIKGFIGKELNAHNQHLINSKSITYSFKNNNNMNSLIASTKLIDVFLKKFFLSIGTLIGKPIYLNRQDKIVIRLFVYFSPKLNLFLKTSLSNQNLWKVFSKEQTILNSTTSIGVNKDGSINIGKPSSPSIKDFKDKVELINPLYYFISNINKVESNKKNQIFFSSFSNKQKNKSWTSLLSQYTKKIASNLIYLNSPSFSSLGANKIKNFKVLSNPSLLKNNLVYSQPILKEKNYFNFINSTTTTKINEIKGSLFSYESYFTLFKPYLENFSLILGSIFNKKVELEIVKLQFPFHDSHILAQILGINANKYNFTLMVNKILQLSHLKNPSKNIWYTKVKKDEKLESKNNPLLFHPSSYLPALFSVEGLNTKWLKKIRTLKMIGNKGKYNSFLSGMSIRLGGRLMTQSIRPRFTTQSMQNGSLARVKVDFVNKSRYTGKNKRGTFSFTVSISHIIHK